MASKIQVVVNVAPRPDFNGFWAIGRFFPNGASECEVTPEELKSLREDAAFLSVVEGTLEKAAAPAKK